MTLTIGSLFSGYGGLDMAVEQVTGATPAWFVEYDAAPSKILAHHWPDVPNYGDVTAVDWETMPPVDIITGGYPCQPFSQAGERKGTNDDRHLWPYVRQAIRHLRPRLVVLENVAGHRSLGLDRVLGDMAEDGLHVRWTSLRASDIGAPHHRERLFILATPTDAVGERVQVGGLLTRDSEQGYPSLVLGGDVLSADAASVERERRESGVARRRDAAVGREAGNRTDRLAEDVTDTDGVGWGEGAEQPIAGPPEVTAPVSSEPPAAHPGGAAVGEHPGGPPAEEAGPGDSHRPGDHRGERPAQVGREDAADAEDDGFSWAGPARHRRARPADGSGGDMDWGPYAAAIRRWERLTRPAPAPTELNRNGKPRLAAPFAEWMMGLPEGHVTQVPGISRTDQLKAIGNGVCVPQGIAALHQLLTSPAPAGHFS